MLLLGKYTAKTDKLSKKSNRRFLGTNEFKKTKGFDKLFL